MPFGHNSLLVSKDSNSIIRSFITNFVSDDFFTKIINICLYPAEFGVMTVNSNNSTITYIQEYLHDVSRSAQTLKLSNINQINEYIRVTSTILTIREGGRAVINYNNALQHLPGLNLLQQKLVQQAILNKLDNLNEFRDSVDQVLNNIGIYHELCIISGELIKYDNLTTQISSPDVSPYEAVKLWRDNIINNYNVLSNLKTLQKGDRERDYFIISDKDSVRDLAKSLVSFISGDYSFYESGYKIFDSNIEGFESSSVHLVTAPSNHGKSLFLLNMAHRIIQNNISDFEPGDTVLFISAEDKYCPVH